MAWREHLYSAFTPEFEEMLKVTIRDLNTGDFEGLLETLRRGNSEKADRYLQYMLDERNQAWMSKLLPQLDAGDAVVNVGAAHLPGLLKLLRRDGYTSEALLLPAAEPRALHQD